MIVLLALAAAMAGDAPPPDRLVYYASAVGRYNPLGGIGTLKLAYRRQFPTGPGVLFRDTWLEVGATTSVRPSFGRGGAYLSIQPMAILRLEASYEGVGWFGSFDNLVSGDEQLAYSDGARRDLDSQGLAYATSGSLLTLTAVLQGMIGPIAIRDTVRGLRMDADLHDGDSVFYDPVHDTLVRDGGWVVNNDVDVIGIIGPAKIGVRWTYTDALLDAGPAAASMHRVGPLVAFTFLERPGSPFDQPTVFVTAQWWLQHPYRTGLTERQAIPMVALGFAFHGDLIPWN